MLKIKQSYHGTGGKDGYKWRLYDEHHRYIGSLESFPINVKIYDIIKISGRLYITCAIYDSELPEDEFEEVVFYELEEWEFTPNYDVGNIVY